MTSRDAPSPGRPMLRVAVPNKGALSQAAQEMLRESGYRQRHDSRELTLLDAENGVEFFYLRPRDIALYVGEGTLDVGITGRDLLRDSGAKAEEVMELGFGSQPVPLRRARRPLLRHRRPRRHPDRHVVRRHRPRLPGAARHRRHRDPARRRRRDQHPARGGRRDRRRRRDRQHAQGCRPGDLRRGDPGVRGGAGHPRRRGAGGVRGLPAPARGRPGRADLRDDGLRHPRGGRAPAPRR